MKLLLKALKPTVIKQKIQEQATAFVAKKVKKGCSSCGKR